MPYPENHEDEPEDLQLDSTIMKLVEQYASCDRRSAEINDERATIRSNAEKLGFTSAEFQDGVARVKKMSKTERDIHERNVARIVRIAETKQAEFWPGHTERQEKRAQRRAEEEANKPRTQAELDAETNANRRSDPGAGGAAREPLQPDGTPWPDDAEVAAREQAEGEQALKDAAPKTAAAAKVSQSAKAKAKLAAAGLN